MNAKQYYVILTEQAAARMMDLARKTDRKNYQVIERLLMNTPESYQLRYVRKDPVYSTEVDNDGESQA